MLARGSSSVHVRRLGGRRTSPKIPPNASDAQVKSRLRQYLEVDHQLDALEAGYTEASTAIFDANITNTIAAALMWYFGSGPIRGFAVVLLIGIVTSVFTAVTFTRMLVSLWVRRARPRELHI